MKKLLATGLFSSVLLMQPALAHISHTGHTQHASEHLLLAALLLPVMWLVLRKLFR